jgi:hypothetical protein
MRRNDSAQNAPQRWQYARHLWAAGFHYQVGGVGTQALSKPDPLARRVRDQQQLPCRCNARQTGQRQPGSIARRHNNRTASSGHDLGVTLLYAASNSRIGCQVVVAQNKADGQKGSGRGRWPAPPSTRGVEWTRSESRASQAYSVTNFCLDR